MKSRFYLAIMLILSLSLSAQAGVYRKSFDYKNFDKIKAGQPTQNYRIRGVNATMEVKIVQDSKYSVEMEIDDEDYADVYSVSLNGKTLVIKTAKVKGNTTPNATITVHMPSISSVDLSGIARATFSGDFKSEKLYIDASGATAMSGLNFTGKGVNLDVSGAASITQFSIEADSVDGDISGAVGFHDTSIKADDLNLDISGAANVKNSEFYSKTLSLDVSGAASISGTTMEFDTATTSFSGGCSASLATKFNNSKIDASGAANLKLSGEANNEITITATGAVRVDAKDLICKNVSVSASGVSSVKVTATESLTTDISMTSSLDYYGNPATVNHKATNIHSH